MNTKTIPIALLMISTGAGYAQSEFHGSHVASMPNSWIMTATNEDGQLIKFGGYHSKEECEKDIPRKEREQHTTYSHCDPREPPPSK
jgi:hypothetical protein